MPAQTTGGVGYWACHRRVKAVRGPAPVHRCADCGTAAAVWSYDGTDPAALTDARGRRYSLDPLRYQPRCRFCQRRAVVDDSAPLRPSWRRPELDAARAEQLYRAGASSRGIAALMGVSRGVVLRALRARAVPIRPPVAPQRRRHRYPVTPRPASAATHAGDREQPQPDSSPPIFNDPTSITASTSPTTTTTSSSSPDQEPQHDQNQNNRTEPQSQSEQNPRARADQRISDPSVSAACPAGPRPSLPKINEPRSSRSC
jgi:hypothetical protein